MDLKEKFKGALVGGAVGDALGAPYEGQPRESLLAAKLRLTEFVRMGGYPLGQFTDDTQLTLVLAESLIRFGRVDGDQLGRSMSELWVDQRIVGPGRATTASMRRLLDGVPWQEAGAGPGEAGNGAAMRAGPMGLWHFDRTEELVRDTVEVSRITHRDDRAVAGAVAMAGAVAHVLRQPKVVPDVFVREVGELAGRVHAGLGEAIGELERLQGLPEKDALPWIASSGAEEVPPADIYHGISGYVFPTVLAVFYFFLRYHEDFEICLCETIRAGGDVDTTAAMVGTLFGAHHGYDALPRHLASNVLDARKIVDTAECLYRRRMSN